MISKVVFEIKNSIRSWSDQEISFSSKNMRNVMDEHLDWIKLEKHLDEDCVLPMNVFRQMIEKLQNQEQNS